MTEYLNKRRRPLLGNGKINTLYVIKEESHCFFDLLCKAWTYFYEHIVQKEEFSITCYMRGTYTWQRPSLSRRDKLIFSSERMLHKDYDRKGSVDKKVSGRDPQGGLAPRRTDWR
jgi:hypothetical protein